MQKYWRMMQKAMLRHLEYRFNFILTLFGMVFYYLSQFSIIAITLLKFKNIQGWQIYELTLLYALILLAQSVNTLIFGPLIRFDEEIRTGRWDGFLTKPVSPILTLLASKFDLSGIVHIIMGVTALIVATTKLQIEVNGLNLFFLIISCTGGALILASIRMMVASVAFYAVSIQSLVHFFVFSSKDFILYPINVYKNPIPFILTFLFPLAFVNFYTAHLFVDKQAMIYPALKYATLPIGIFMFTFSVYLFKRGMQRYHSTGS